MVNKINKRKNIKSHAVLSQLHYKMPFFLYKTYCGGGRCQMVAPVAKALKTSPRNNKRHHGGHIHPYIGEQASNIIKPVNNRGSGINPGDHQTSFRSWDMAACILGDRRRGPIC